LLYSATAEPTDTVALEGNVDECVVGKERNSGGDNQCSKVPISYQDRQTTLRESSSTSYSSPPLSSSSPLNPILPTTKYSYPGCTLYLAKSTLGEDTGLGLFSARSLPRGYPVAPGDIVIQVPDYNEILHVGPNIPHIETGQEYDRGMMLLVHDYGWDGQETGGHYEGKNVMSLLPGIGFLANGHPTLHNVIPFRADVDEANVPRTTSPGAGSFSHYHNFTFFSSKVISSGDEIFVNYGTKYFQRHGHISSESTEKKNTTTSTAVHSEESTHHSRPLEWLEEHGICVDTLKAGPSTIPGAGRGAFSTKYIPKGAVVAPAPLIPITNRDSLRVFRRRAGGSGGKRNDGEIEETIGQLLINYCFGHTNSSVLFFPYSPIVNLINHDSHLANVVVQWSHSSQHRGTVYIHS